MSIGIAQSQQLIPLYNGNPPNSQPSADQELQSNEGNLLRISLVQNPDIKVYLPSANMATGEAVVICPGGGYHILAYEHEGTDFAKYFNAKGIAAIVLKYRLPISKSNVVPHQSPLLDAQRAIRITRFNAAKWNIDVNKVGIMGSSAGGHLASTASTHFDLGHQESPDSVEQMSCRPDFSLLLYPVISFNDKFTHKGSKNALLQDEVENPELVAYYSNELQIDSTTPPAILIHASDDGAVPVENSLVYYQALQKSGIEAEMHIYPHGGHGFGLATKRGYLSEWPDRCVNFIRSLTNTKE